MKRLIFQFLPILVAAQVSFAGEPILDSLKGIILTSCLESPAVNQPGVQVRNLDLPNRGEELNNRLQEYLNTPLTEASIRSIKGTIVAYYEELSRPIVKVEVPEQEISAGCVRIVVKEGQLGEIRCLKNRYFSDRNIKKYLRLSPGQMIPMDQVLKGIAFINNNPFRMASAVFTPGKTKGTTDIELVMEERIPLREYAGGDNTGNDFTGNARFYAGINWANAFNWDAQLNYQYTTSADFHKFQAHTLQFILPNSLRQSLVFYGGIAFVHPNFSSLENQTQPSGSFSSKSMNWQGSVRYEIPFGMPVPSMRKEVRFGFDFKHIENNLAFIGDNASRIPLQFKNVNVSQLAGSLSYAHQNKQNFWSFQIDGYYSPGQVFSGQSRADYDNARAGAKSQYAYCKGIVEDTWTSSRGWQLVWILQAQAATGVLLPSEQFALGGYETVRGYDEREFNADQALLANFEIHTPSFSLFSSRGKWKDRMYFLLFTDCGGGWNYSSSDNEASSEYLGSVGPGFRYSFIPYLLIRFDYGFKLNRNEVLGTSIGKFHVGVNLSY